MRNEGRQRAELWSELHDRYSITIKMVAGKYGNYAGQDILVSPEDVEQESLIKLWELTGKRKETISNMDAYFKYCLSQIAKGMWRSSYPSIKQICMSGCNEEDSDFIQRVHSPYSTSFVDAEFNLVLDKIRRRISDLGNEILSALIDPPAEVTQEYHMKRKRVDVIRKRFSVNIVAHSNGSMDATKRTLARYFGVTVSSVTTAMQEIKEVFNQSTSVPSYVQH